MNAQKGCCDWFFRCFKGNNRPDPKENVQLASTIQKQKTLDQPPQSNEVHQNTANRPPENAIPSANNANPELIPYRHVPLINTKYKAEEIISNIIPDRTRNIKYNCPICLKYFNHILVLKCCLNYVCHMCVHEYIDTSTKYNLQVKCPVCNFSEQLNLDDVDPDAKVKLKKK